MQYVEGNYVHVEMPYKYYFKIVEMWFPLPPQPKCNFILYIIYALIKKVSSTLEFPGVIMQEAFHRFIY